MYIFNVEIFNATTTSLYSDPQIVHSILKKILIQNIFFILKKNYFKADIDLSISRLGELKEYGSAFLECLPNLSSEKAIYTWFKDDLKLNKSSSNLTISQNRLWFNYLRHELDDGIYNCEITILRNEQKIYSPGYEVLINRKLRIF